MRLECRDVGSAASSLWVLFSLLALATGRDQGLQLGSHYRIISDGEKLSLTTPVLCRQGRTYLVLWQLGEGVLRRHAWTLMNFPFPVPAFIDLGSRTLFLPLMG